MIEKILVKYPTRQRPDLFLRTLKEYIDTAYDNTKIIFLVSYDIDDETMSQDIIQKALDMGGNVIMKPGVSLSKIDACNRDINSIPEEMYDCILLISDDMHVQKKDWDKSILDYYKKFYPDDDGCLWLHDGSSQEVINTLTCVTKKYYQRFGYLYHPAYKSFFSDNEYTDVAKSLKKITFINDVIIKHNHPQWGGKTAIDHDDLYHKNNGPWDEDQRTYQLRKSLNFVI